MIHDDLFGELTDTARVHGWLVDEPSTRMRHYLRGEHRLTVGSNLSGTAIARVALERTTVVGPRTLVQRAWGDRGKRGFALAVLRGAMPGV